MKKNILIFTFSIVFIFIIINPLLFSQNGDETWKNQFGLNTHSFPIDNITTEEDKKKFLDLGVKWIRGGLEWFEIEDLEGNYNWDNMDEIVRFAQEHEINIYYSLCYTPERYSSNKYDLPEEHVDKWVEFVKRVVDRYDGEDDNYKYDEPIDMLNLSNPIKHWGIWNEPNIDFWSGTRKQFIDNVLIPAIDAIRDADPDAKICGPELDASDVGYRNLWSVEIFGTLMAQGDNEKYLFDIITTHQYQGGDTVDGRKEDLKDYYDFLKDVIGIDFNEPGMEFWVTESSWKHGSFKGKTEEECAEFFFHFAEYMTRKDWWHKIFYFNFKDGPDDTKKQEGLLWANGSPKWVYHSFRYLIQKRPAKVEILGLYEYSEDPNVYLFWMKDKWGHKTFFLKDKFEIKQYSYQIMDKDDVEIAKGTVTNWRKDELYPWVVQSFDSSLFDPDAQYKCIVNAQDGNGWSDESILTCSIYNSENNGIDPIDPDKGDKIMVECSTNISWMSISDIQGPLKISLMKGVVEVGVIDSNVSSAARSYTWQQVSTMGAGAGNNFKIRISTLDGTHWGETDGTFSIVNASSNGITFKSPKSGNIWVKGTKNEIEYLLPMDEKYKEDLQGRTLMVLLHGLTEGMIKRSIDSEYNEKGDKTDWNWEIRTLLNGTDIKPASGYRIELIANRNYAIRGTSAPFTIIDNHIEITAPTEGEVLNIGENYYVTYNCPPVDGPLKMYLYKDGELYKSGVIFDLFFNDGGIHWVINKLKDGTPIKYGFNYQIELVAHNYRDVKGMSAMFTIHDPRTPAITVTSPNGGETFNAGSVMNITWTSVGEMGDVTIEGSKNNGASWRTIVTSTPNDGIYQYIVPEVLVSDNCLIRISELDGDPSDVSNSTFSIIPQQPPVPPILVSPVNNTQTIDTTPTFSWAAVNCFPEVTNYRITITDNNSGTVHRTATLGNVTSYTLPQSYPLTVNNEYYVWQVQARNSLGWGDYGAAYTIIARERPPSPQAVYPKGGIKITNTRPGFQWQAVTSIPGVTGYKIQVEGGVGNNYDFSKTIGNQTTYTLPSSNMLSRGKQYKWRVKAKNAITDNGYYCGWKYFTVE